MRGIGVKARVDPTERLRTGASSTAINHDNLGSTLGQMPPN
jgi:hypothetical protein